MPITNKNAKAILAMLLAVLGYLLNDTLTKLASESLSIGQVVFVRGIMSLIVMGIACKVTGALKAPRLLLHKVVVFRTLGEILSTAFYVSALAYLPIANATAITQATPLLVTAGAAVFLRDKVGWRRSLAILVGFAGVMVIVRPGLDGFGVWALVALMGVFFMAFRDLCTRVMSPDIPVFAVALLVCVANSATGVVMMSFEELKPLTVGSVFICTAAALCLLIGYVFLILATRDGEIAVVSPFRYFSVVGAICLGFVIWGDIPDVLTMTGIVMIVVSGLYSLLRERKLAGPGEASCD